jgi:peptidoglycan hydrolase-like protein with peptidoglycan-binding domain
VFAGISRKGASVATLSYRQSELILRRGGDTATNAQVRDLQRDLRRLGYLQRGIDGDFGSQTELAVKGLQHDLLHNDGGGSDGSAAVRIVDFITVGLDRNAGGQPHIITSRGYGAGQFTLFHHPPQHSEVADFMLDVGKNLQKASNELKEKFDQFVIGTTAGTRADDRIAEIGTGPLRPCKFKPDEPGFMRDCKQCLLDAGKKNIVANVTPVFNGSAMIFASTSLYNMNRDASMYQDVPVRAEIPCDWPYAVRRYNGSGLLSYHYRVRVLKHLQSL